jgi:ABC-type bacteriocin/lantibiotic exporter with double-glycine peptidase domain
MRFINYYNELKILEYPELRQVYTYDCGANALQSALTYYGYDMREDEIMKEAGTTDKGSTSAGLKKTLTHFNIPFIDGKFTVDDLKIHIDNKWPTIMPIQAYPENPEDWDYSKDWEDGHWVTAIGYSTIGVIFEDPSSTKRTFISFENLEKRWHDIDEEGTKLEHYGIVCKGKPDYRANDIIIMEGK